VAVIVAWGTTRQEKGPSRARCVNALRDATVGRYTPDQAVPNPLTGVDTAAGAKRGQLRLLTEHDAALVMQSPLSPETAVLVVQELLQAGQPQVRMAGRVKRAIWTKTAGESKMGMGSPPIMAAGLFPRAGGRPQGFYRLSFDRPGPGSFGEAAPPC